MKLTKRGQITIPADIRRKMGLLPNTEVEFVIAGEHLILRKASRTHRRSSKLISMMRGRATRQLTTNQIMALTRGE